ncbi:toxin glutamine deamidase domain-containing protein [Amycolatopsis sp. cmx-11-12]|uniref:toxin glutamine deamidase domain-containing protein n=1 Tax=Amycolatopsis sp. cmx-11-12 TaxID=2785795 RepID=UPI0039172606
MEDKGPPSGDFWNLILSEGGESADVYYPPDSAVHSHEKAEAFKAAAGHVRQAVTRTNDIVTQLHSTAWRDRGGASMRELVQTNNNGENGIGQIAAGLDSLGGAYESYANLLVEMKDKIHDTYDRNHLIYIALGCNLPGVRSYYRRKLAEGVADDIADMIRETAANMLNPTTPDVTPHDGFFGGLWDSAVVQFKAIVGLAGFGEGFWSLYNAQQAWGNLGLLVGGAVLYTLDPNVGKFVDDKLFNGVFGDVLTEFGKNFVDHQAWGKDWWHVAGYTTGNLVGLIGTRGAGAGIARGARALGKGARAVDLTGFPKGVHKVGEVVSKANLTGLTKYGLGKASHVVDNVRNFSREDRVGVHEAPRAKETPAPPRPGEPGQGGTRPTGDPGGTPPPPGPKEPVTPSGGTPPEAPGRGPGGPENHHPSGERTPTVPERESPSGQHRPEQQAQHPAEAPARKPPEVDTPPKDVQGGRPPSHGPEEIQRSPNGPVPEHGPERVAPAADAAKNEGLSHNPRGGESTSPSTSGRGEGAQAPMSREVFSQTDVMNAARGSDPLMYRIAERDLQNSARPATRQAADSWFGKEGGAGTAPHRGDTPPPGPPSGVDKAAKAEPVAKAEPWAEAAKHRQGMREMREQLDAMARQEARAAEGARAGEAEKSGGTANGPVPSREISGAERLRGERLLAQLDEVRPRLDELRDRQGGVPSEASKSLKLLDELLSGRVTESANKMGWAAFGERMREGTGPMAAVHGGESAGPRGGHAERQRFDAMWRDLEGMKAELDGLLEKAPAPGARAEPMIGPRESAAPQRSPDAGPSPRSSDLPSRPGPEPTAKPSGGGPPVLSPPREPVGLVDVAAKADALDLARGERLMKADIEAALKHPGEPVASRPVSAAERARGEKVLAGLDELRPRLDELRDRQGGLPKEASESVRLLEKLLFGEKAEGLAGWRSLDEWIKGETRSAGVSRGVESSAKRFDDLWSKLDGVKAELDGLLEKAPAPGARAEPTLGPRESAAPERSPDAGPTHRYVDAPPRPAPEPTGKPRGGGPPVLSPPRDPLGIVDAVDKARTLERAEADRIIKEQIAAANETPRGREVRPDESVPQRPLSAEERLRWESARTTLDEMKPRFGELRDKGGELPKAASDSLRLLDEWSAGGLSETARETGRHSLVDWVRNEAKPADVGSLRRRFDELWPNLDGLKAELTGLLEKAPTPVHGPRPEGVAGPRIVGSETGLRQAVGDGVAPPTARGLHDSAGPRGEAKPDRPLVGLPSTKGELKFDPLTELGQLRSFLGEALAGRLDRASEPFVIAKIERVGTELGKLLDVGPPTRAAHHMIVQSRHLIDEMTAEVRGTPSTPRPEPEKAPGTLSSQLRAARVALEELKAGTTKFLYDNRARFDTDLPAPWSPEALSTLIGEERVPPARTEPPTAQPLPNKAIIAHPDGAIEPLRESPVRPRHYVGPDQGARPVPGWTEAPVVGRPVTPDVGRPVETVPGDPEIPVPGRPVEPGPGFPEPPSTNPVRPETDPATPGAPKEPDRPPEWAPERSPEIAPPEIEAPVQPLTPFGPARPGPEDPVRPLEIPPLPGFVGAQPVNPGSRPQAPVRPLTPGGRERPDPEIPTDIPLELRDPDIPLELSTPDPDVSGRPPSAAPDPRWPFPLPPRAAADPEPPAEPADESRETHLDKVALGLEPGRDLTPEERAKLAAQDVQSPELPALRRALGDLLDKLRNMFPDDYPAVFGDLANDKHSMEERVLLAGKYLDLVSPNRPGSHPPDELPRQVEEAAPKALARLDRELADGVLSSEEVQRRKEAWADFTRQAGELRDVIAEAERSRDIRPLLDKLREFGDSLREYAREHADSAVPAWPEVVAFDLLDPHRMRFLQPSVTAGGRFDVVTQAIVLHWLETIFGRPGADFVHRMLDSVVPWDKASIERHPKRQEILDALAEAGVLQRDGVALPELGLGLIQPRIGMGEFLTTLLHEFTVHLLQEPKPTVPYGNTDTAWLEALLHASHEFQGRSGELLAIEALRAAAGNSVVPRELRGEVVPRGLRIPLGDWNSHWMKRLVDIEFSGLPEARRAVLLEQLRAIGFDHEGDIAQIHRAVAEDGHPPILTPAVQEFKADPAGFAAKYPPPPFQPPRPYGGQVDVIWPDPMIDPVGHGHGFPFEQGNRRPRHPQRQAPHPQRGGVTAPRPVEPPGLPAELKPLWEALAAEERRTLADLTAEVGPRAGLPVLTNFTTLLARKNGFPSEAGASLARWLGRIAPPTGLPAEWTLVWHALPAVAQRAFTELIAAVGAAAATTELAERVAGLTTSDGGILEQIVDLQGHPERFDVLGEQLTASIVPLSAGVPTAVWAVLTDPERSALTDIGRVDGLNALGTLTALTAAVAGETKPSAVGQLPAVLTSFPADLRRELAHRLTNFLGEGAADPRPLEQAAPPATAGPVPIETGKPVTGKTDPAAVEQALWRAFPDAVSAAGMTIVGWYTRSAVVADPDGRTFTVLVDVVVADLGDATGQWSVPRRDSMVKQADTVRITASSRMPLDEALRLLVHGLAAGHASLSGDRAADPGARFLSPEGNLDAKPAPTPADRGYLAQLVVLERALDGARWNLPKRFRLQKEIREVLGKLGLDPNQANHGHRQAALENEPVRWVVTRHLPPTKTDGYPLTSTHVATGLITGFLPAGGAAAVFAASGSPASGVAWGVFGLVNAVYSGFLARDWDIKKDEQVAEGRKYDLKAREIDAAAAPATRARSLLEVLGWSPQDGPDVPADKPVDEQTMGPKPDLAQSLRKHVDRFSVPPLAALGAGSVTAVSFELLTETGVGLPSWLSLGVYAVGAALWLPFAERARTRVQKGAELKAIDKRARGLDKAEADVYAAIGQRLGLERPPEPSEVPDPRDAHLSVPELSVAANLPDFSQYLSEILRRGLRPTAAGTIDNTALLAQHLTLFQGLAAYGAGKSLLMLPIAIWQLNKLDQSELGYTVDRRSFDERDIRRLMRPDVLAERMALLDRVEKMVNPAKPGPLRRLLAALPFVGRPKPKPEPVRPVVPSEPSTETRPGFAPRAEFMKTYTRLSLGSSGVTVVFVEVFGASESLAMAALVAGLFGPVIGWRKWWHRRHELELGDKDIAETNQGKAAERAAVLTAASAFVDTQVMLSAATVAAELERADRSQARQVASTTAAVPEFTAIKINVHEYPYGNWASLYQDALRELRRSLDAEAARLNPDQPRRDWGDYRTLGERRVAIEELLVLAKRAATYLDDHHRTGNGLPVWEANADLSNAIDEYRWLNSPEWPKALDPAPDAPRRPGDDPEVKQAEEAAVRHLQYRDPPVRRNWIDHRGGWQGSSERPGGRPGDADLPFGHGSDGYLARLIGTTELNHLPSIHAGIPSAGRYGIARYIREHHPELPRTNPKYHSPNARQDGYQTNCTRDVVYYVRRLRGEDVTAPPLRPADSEVLGNLAYISDRLGGIWDESHGTSYDSVIAAMMDRPSGAMAVLAMEYRVADGRIKRHVALVANDNGRIVFLDPQDGWLLSLPESPVKLDLLPFTDVDLPPAVTPKGVQPPRGDLHLPEPELRPQDRVVVVSPEGHAQYRSFLELGREQGYNGKDDGVRLGSAEVEAISARETGHAAYRENGNPAVSGPHEVSALFRTTRRNALPAMHAKTVVGRWATAVSYLLANHRQLPATNPDYYSPNALDDGYLTNCTRSVVYYVRRLRGEDVTAPPVPLDRLQEMSSLEYISDRLGGTWDHGHGTSYDSVIAAMTDRPVGALAVIHVTSTERGGSVRDHVALVSRDANGVVFLEPHNGWLMRLPRRVTGIGLLTFTDAELPPRGHAAIFTAATAEVARRGAEEILHESVLASPPGPIDLTDAQWAAVRAVRERIDGIPDSLPAAEFRPEDLERVNELADWLAEAAGGTSGHGDAETTAAFVVFDKVSWAYQALDVVREHLGTDPMEIVGLEDRFVRPRHDGYRDLRLVLRLPNGHLAELQLRLKAIEEVVETARALDETVGTLIGKAEERTRPLSRGEEALEVAILRRRAELFDEATKRGLPSPPPPGPETFGDEAETAMTAAEPLGCVEFGDGRQSANATYHLTYADHPRTIYKPASGETRALGSHLPLAGQGYRENAMYRLARAVGSDAVPPTAYLDGPLGPGSSQVWRGDAGPALEVSAYPREQQQLIAFLDYVAASLDRSSNDCLTGPDGEAIVIDNGQSFPDYADPLIGIRSGFVAAWFDEPFDAEVLAAIRAIDPAWLVRMLVATGIGDEAADGARDRLEEIQRLGRIAGQRWPARIWDHEWKLVREFK